ncbi:MAG: hypothetical protein WDZ41_02915 [Candidatus Babeliales bacterium]
MLSFQFKTIYLFLIFIPYTAMGFAYGNSKLNVLEQSIEDMKKMYDAIDPDPKIKKITEKAIKNCGIKTSPIILQRNNGDNSYAIHHLDNSSQPFMLIGVDNQTLAQIKFATYHECGHLYFQDSNHNEQSFEKFKKIRNLSVLGGLASSYGMFKYLKPRINNPFISVSAALASGFVSFVGLILKPVHWQRSERRNQEIKADLFAYKNLLKINRPDIALTWILDCAQDYECTGIQKATPFDEYPCSYERAKIGLEFLKANGVNIENPNLPTKSDPAIKQYLSKILKHFSIK